VQSLQITERHDYHVKQYQYILWDWNGTIIDDVGVALDAVNHMLRQKHLPTITLQEYRQAMDTPILHFYERFFDMSRTRFEWITEQFHDYYDSHQKDLRLHHGVKHLLQSQKEKGTHQVILSSSATLVIRRYVDKFCLSSCFEDVLGADDLLSAGKIERAKTYFQRQKLRPEEVVLLGDTVHDYEVAKALGTDCILLTFGHQDRESLLACGCPVYDAIDEIPCFSGND
jgi:phosphoglycolate phosphatase